MSLTISAQSPERAALELFRAVVREGAYCNLALKELPAVFTAEQRRYITAWLYGALDRCIELDFILAHYAKGKLTPVIEDILRLGAYQLLYMRRPDYAVCSLMTSLAASVGKGALKGYVNAVLRSISRQGRPPLPQDAFLRLCVTCSAPAFLVRGVQAELKEETEAFFNAPPPPDGLRVAQGADPAALISQLAEEGVWAEQNPRLPNALLYKGDISASSAFKKGLCSPQGEASMLACLALQANKTHTVLDACAAPGGKTLYLCELAGFVDARDSHPHKLALIVNNARRMGLSNLTAEIGNAAEAGPAKYHRILADVPCSGLGMLGRKPDIKLTLTPEKLQSLEKLQGHILRALAMRLLPGGLLVYSTCTCRQGENQRQIEAFLEEFPDFKRQDFSASLPAAAREQYAPHMQNGMLSLYPHRHHTEGFFIACLQRQA